MTRVVLAAVLLGATALPAFAGDFECDRPQVFKGKVGRNPVTSIFVHYNPNNGAWSISHTLADGKRINREDQYNITDRTSDARAHGAAAGWSGYLGRNPYLFMNGQLFYAVRTVEVMRATAACRVEGESPTITAQPSPPTYSPPTYSAPAPSYGNGFAVPIANTGSRAYVAVNLGIAQTATMLIDTGCTDMTVTQSIADALLQSGAASASAPMNVTFADGSIHSVQQITIHQIEIGGHALSNVNAGVSPNSADMLLGFPILNKLGKFTIDTQNNQLVFG
jgi:clan AA aspartic protease (TIGR02281 family)